MLCDKDYVYSTIHFARSYIHRLACGISEDHLHQAVVSRCGVMAALDHGHHGSTGSSRRIVLFFSIVFFLVSCFFGVFRTACRRAQNPKRVDFYYRVFSFKVSLRHRKILLVSCSFLVSCFFAVFGSNFPENRRIPKRVKM